MKTSRIILHLRSLGWSDKKINDYILWLATGEEQYKSKDDKEKE